MKKYTRYLLVLLGCTILSLSAAAENDPKALIEKAMKYAAGLDSISMSMNMTMALMFPGGVGNDTTQFDGKLDLRGDKEFFMSVSVESEGAEIMSDGEHQVVHMIHEQTYEKGQAPIERVRSMGLMPGGPASDVSAFLGLFLENDKSALLGTTEFELLGEEAVSVRGADGSVSEIVCNHIRFRSLQNIVDLWIQKNKKPLLHMLKLDMSETYAGQPGAPEKLTVTYAMSGVEPNAKFADDRFTFKPPTGVREVKPNQDPMLGAKAPDFDLELLAGGRLKLSELIGKNVIVLDFWATWCGPCKVGMPAILEVTNEYKDKGVSLYALNQGESRERVESYLAQSGLDLVVARDPSSQTSMQYKANSIPRTIIIGKDGIIHKAHYGIPQDINYYKKQLRGELEEVLLIEATATSKTE
jgi:thiol-disulfide isomerase/thioredoxin